MSEYQRYEFMTVDRPLTQEQLKEVNRLSSHIEASSTHAIIEYHHGDFKHNPILVLRDYFDGFLYWANWGSPQLALRFPHGALPADIMDNYNFDDFVAFTKYQDYDILEIEFPELEAPDEWTEYDLGSMIGIRDELMEGDLRALYIAWLAVQEMIGIEDEADEKYDTKQSIPPVPPNFKKLTSAQQELANFLQVTPELLVAAAQYSEADTAKAKDDFVAWIERLPQERRTGYLLRLANNEPGLSRQLVKELRELGRGKATTTEATGERVTYSTLLTESKALKSRLARERREEQQRARERQLQYVHDHQEEYWREIEQGVERKNSTGYDEALRLLIELREAMQHFNEEQQFEERFRSWVLVYLRSRAFVDRLRARKFTIPRA
jgi:hypothetical protein